MATRAPMVMGSTGLPQRLQAGDSVDAALLSGLGTASVVSAKGFRGLLHGLTLSNNATDASNDIDIAAGVSWDNINDVLMEGSGATKRLDASWVAGSGNGGLFSGSKASSTWYHVFQIGTSGGTIDYGFDTSVTAANLPGGYSRYRRLGSFMTDGSSNIRGFVQRGDWFLLNTGVAILSGATPPTSPTAVTVISPLGVVCRAIASGISVSSSGQKNYYLADAVGARYLPIVSYPSEPDERSGEFWTNTSSQIMHNSGGATNHTVSLNSFGWIDRRGQDG